MLGPNAGSDQKVGCTLLPVGRATGAHFSLSVFPTQFAFSVFAVPRIHNGVCQCDCQRRVCCPHNIKSIAPDVFAVDRFEPFEHNFVLALLGEQITDEPILLLLEARPEFLCETL